MIDNEIQKFSQVEVEEPDTSPENPLKGEKEVSVQESVVSIREKELAADIANLSGSELRKKYHREANSHKNSKSRCKRSGYEWHPDFDSFKEFLQHLGPCPGEGYTLDRIDPSDPEYAPGKVRWASKAAQTHNRQNTRYLTNSDGVTLSATEWSRRTGIPWKTICVRVDRYGWSVDEATTIPVGGRRTKVPVDPQTGEVLFHYTSSTPLVGVWSQIIADVHGQKFCSFTAAEKKMIKDLANRFESGRLNAIEVITLVLTHWHSFTSYTERDHGAFGNTPSVPNIHFLVKYCNAAGNFFMEMKQKEIEAARRQAEFDKQLREMEEQRQAEELVQTKLEAMPDFQKLAPVLDKFEEHDWHLESLVTPEMREYIEQTFKHEFLSIDGRRFLPPSDLSVVRRVKFLLMEELVAMAVACRTGEDYQPSSIMELISQPSKPEVVSEPS